MAGTTPSHVAHRLRVSVERCVVLVTLVGCGMRQLVIVVATSEEGVLPVCPACETALRTWGVRPRARGPDGRVHTSMAALLDHIAGHGHRPIAERLHRPAATVRGRLRRATAVAAFWRRRSVIYASRLDPDAGPFRPRTTALAEALGALGEAARVGQERHASWPAPGPWGAVTVLTGGGSSRPHEWPATASTRS
ncbi:hypothetical protein [Streptomyces violascens]|uniref:hypothetical protein n=1 Tax=Streptomyces violascens TaxID=67381 RepID=UPI0036767566